MSPCASPIAPPPSDSGGGELYTPSVVGPDAAPADALRPTPPAAARRAFDPFDLVPLFYGAPAVRTCAPGTCWPLILIGLITVVVATSDGAPSGRSTTSAGSATCATCSRRRTTRRISAVARWARPRVVCPCGVGLLLMHRQWTYIGRCVHPALRAARHHRCPPASPGERADSPVRLRPSHRPQSGLCRAFDQLEAGVAPGRPAAAAFLLVFIIVGGLVLATLLPTRWTRTR